MKLNYTILSKEPHVLIKFFYEGENGEYGEFKMELQKLSPEHFDANRPKDSLAVNGTAQIFSNNSDGALDLVAAFAKAMKTEEPKTDVNFNKIFGARNLEKDIYHAGGGKECHDPECKEAHFPF